MVHTDSEWRTAKEVVESALSETIYECQSLERLPGGFINFTFCDKPATPIDGHRMTVVVKMTEDKLKIEETTGEEFTLHKTRNLTSGFVFIALRTSSTYDKMMYCGVHLIIWPCRTEWSKSSKLMDCIAYGCDILENALRGNADRFEEGIFVRSGLFRTVDRCTGYFKRKGFPDEEVLNYLGKPLAEDLDVGHPHGIHKIKNSLDHKRSVYATTEVEYQKYTKSGTEAAFINVQQGDDNLLLKIDRKINKESI
ncbi:hypothetical protein BKA64DRAFT_717825 [Cadophora sp. MPI-SDFR-AT-0126]|nr:hypothetical protein BKA64DRAFT_717825 [Leotiomycetes sp. MPI-SDFR-AT-0126]